MTMLFNLNMRGENKITMRDPSLSHLTSQLQTRADQIVGGAPAVSGGCNDITIYIGHDTAIEAHEVSSDP